MCGIVGYLSRERFAAGPGEIIRRMMNAIIHRGPDSACLWQDEDVGVTFGFRRLAIIDVSPAGDQPMISSCGRYVIVFNGEIYNHKAIRSQLENEGQAASWRGHSDTEVLLAAISAWGLTRTLQAANGMFAIALWDRKARALSLARDRFGEKPLYYGWLGGSFVFGSEIKALMQFPNWKGRIDNQALSLYMRYGNVPAPYSIFEKVYKLTPGTIITVPWRDVSDVAGTPTTTPYWSSRDVVESAVRSPLAISETDALIEFERLFSDAVGLRMEADVPLGAFLSGGFDSTATVAAMQKRSSRAVRTFTIGFTQAGYDEAPFARAVARHLGTEHTEFYVSPQHAMEIIPKLPKIYSEPFADSSQIPTFLVSQLARNSVTVALSGDGGDELFGGYNRHFIYDRINRLASPIPKYFRGRVAKLIAGISPKYWNSLYLFATLGRRKKLIGDHVHKLAAILSTDVLLDGYQLLVSSGLGASVLVNPSEATDPITSAPLPAGLRLVEQMMYLDLVNYLPDDILTKVDRATMAVGLEGRIPFLDHRIMEFAWRLPHQYKIHAGVGKHIVRKLVYRHVPRSMMDRPKAGFGIPLDIWLRGPLRDWVSSILDPSRLKADGYLNAENVNKCWQEHLSGRRNLQSQLWTIVMFQCWLDEYKQQVSNATM